MTGHLHFDLIGGIAGDMTVAALVDAGVPEDVLHAGLVASGLPFTALRVEQEWRGGLAGRLFHVDLETDPPARDWKTIRALIEQATLSDGARRWALRIFTCLAEAEATVHGCPVEAVHFHEVGAMDSIVDVVATALALDHLQVDSFSCGPVPLCRGTIEADHGVLPLPAPATAALLTGFELVTIPGTLETVTPTGAAILSALVDDPAAPMPPLRLTAGGYGLGQADLPGRANVLRVLVGTRTDNADAGARHGDRGRAVVIEAAIDDMDPRLFGEVSRNLFAAGALDVTLSALMMKKQRPGTLLSVVCRPESEGVLSGLLLRETTTLGVRSHDVRRIELARRIETVETEFGPIAVKFAFLGDECVNSAPEYDECERAARERGVPLKDVLGAAAAAAHERAGTLRAPTPGGAP